MNENYLNKLQASCINQLIYVIIKCLSEYLNLKLYFIENLKVSQNDSLFRIIANYFQSNDESHLNLVLPFFNENPSAIDFKVAKAKIFEYLLMVLNQEIDGYNLPQNIINDMFGVPEKLLIYNKRESKNKLFIIGFDIFDERNQYDQYRTEIKINDELLKNMPLILILALKQCSDETNFNIELNFKSQTKKICYNLKHVISEKIQLNSFSYFEAYSFSGNNLFTKLTEDDSPLVDAQYISQENIRFLIYSKNHVLDADANISVIGDVKPKNTDNLDEGVDLSGSVNQNVNCKNEIGKQTTSLKKKSNSKFVNKLIENTSQMLNDTANKLSQSFVEKTKMQQSSLKSPINSSTDQVQPDITLNINNPFTSSQNKKENHVESNKDINSKAKHKDENNVETFTAGVCGLINEENSCFLNAAVQCLSNIEELTNHVRTYKKSIHKNSLVNVYGELLDRLWSGKYDVTDARNLKDFMKIHLKKIEANKKNDLNKFLLCFITLLTNELKQKNLTEIEQILHASTKNIFTCQKCKSKCTTCEPLIIFNLPIPRKSKVTLDECLRLFESTEEAVLWQCETCYEDTTHLMKIKFAKLPNALLLSFKTSTDKTFADIKYTEEIILKNSQLYTLIGVVNYSDLKHYKSYCKNYVNHEWYCFDDNKVYQTNIDDVIKNPAYLLVYLKSKVK